MGGCHRDDPSCFAISRDREAITEMDRGCSPLTTRTSATKERHVCQQPMQQQ